MTCEKRCFTEAVGSYSADTQQPESQQRPAVNVFLLFSLPPEVLQMSFPCKHTHTRTHGHTHTHTHSPHLLLVSGISLGQRGVQDHVPSGPGGHLPADHHGAVSDIKQLQVVHHRQGHCTTQTQYSVD